MQLKNLSKLEVSPLVSVTINVRETNMSQAESNANSIYYDPYNTTIDDNPYPTWKQLRDHAPLYYNDEHDFYALSRWDDVEAGLLDWETYRSGRGTILGVIRSGVEIPPGLILWEDPPAHDLHKNILTKIFTPKKMEALEPLVRNYCSIALDRLIDKPDFDMVADVGAFVPMRTIGYLLGIPEEDQVGIRQHTDDMLNIEDGNRPIFDDKAFENMNALMADYIDWRAKHPSDDLMTQLLYTEVEEDGKKRRLSRTEVLTFSNLIAGGGAETATRLIAFTAQLLADHPDQRRQIIEDGSLVRPTIEEVLRYEAPSPVQCRYTSKDVEIYGKVVPKDAVVLLLNGSANRDERHFDKPDEFNIHRATKGRAHLSFGYGLHLCLGAALARLEGRVVLEEMLKRWPEWDVDYSRAKKAHTASVRGWATLPIIPKSA